MERFPLDRRQFLKAATAAAGTFTLAGGGAFALPSAPAARPGAGGAGRQTYVRRNLCTYTAADYGVLERGIGTMQGRDVTDVTSWAFQAHMHGTYATPTTPQQKLVWNTCQHGSFFFVAWHRMYLYYLERILRAASGSTTFALPYWNYTDPTQRCLPPPYRDPSTVLYVSQRNSWINNGSPLSSATVDYSQAFSYANFLPATGAPPDQSFGGGVISGPTQFGGVYGELEIQPHNVVHSAIGGWMGNPMTAAQDPIFWAHHANIDRLWSYWIASVPGAANPTGNSTWMNTPFTFYDYDGSAQKLTASEILNTAAAPLDYTYDDVSGGTCPASSETCPAPAAAREEIRVQPGQPPRRRRLHFTRPRRLPAPAAALARTAPGVTLGADPVTVTLPVAAPAARRALADGRERLLLVLEGIDLERHPEIFYDVYLGPAADEAGFVGTIDFFEIVSHLAHSARSGGYTVAVEATEPLRARAPGAADQVTVTFVPRAGVVLPAGTRPMPRSPVRIAAVSVHRLR
jgi:tyrosinase